MSKYLIRTVPGDDGSVKAQFTWTIDNFLDRPEKQREVIKSPTFTVKKEGCATSKWDLALYPRGYHYSEDDVCIFFYNVKKIPVKISYDVSILDLNLKKHKTTRELKIDSNSGNGLHKWLSRQSLKNDSASLLPGGQMTVYFELTVHSAPPEVSPSPEGKEDTDSCCNRFKEVGACLVKLLDDKDLTDMTIKCGGEDFPCHSLVMSARSPVFKAMFQANMKESETKEVVIEDIEPAVFAEMLHFIYTGGTNEDTLKDVSVELLAAADKYELLSLKEICEDNLCSGLTNSNAVQYLILGDLYKALKLRENALKEVATNMASIVKTEAYQELKQYPDILIDIPKAMIE